MGAFEYLFGSRPAQDDQQTAQRATFQRYQGLPLVSVQGPGQLVTQNGVFGGKYWSVIQPPQVMVLQKGPTQSVQGAGVDFAGLATQALTANKPGKNSGLS